METALIIIASFIVGSFNAIALIDNATRFVKRVKHSTIKWYRLITVDDALVAFITLLTIFLMLYLDYTIITNR